MTKSMKKSSSKSKKSQKRQSTKKQTTKKQSIPIIKINDKTDISKYISQPPTDMVKPKTWELRNRKTFYEWLHQNFGKYELGDNAKLAKIEKEGIHPSKDRPIPNFKLLPIQKIVRDFMQTEAPYRGILLYFGLGVGKTISAVAVSEAIHNKKGVMVFSKASLEPNFISGGPKKAGQDMMIKENYWYFTDSNNPTVEALAKQLGVPIKVVNENGGLFIIDLDKHYSNYADMTPDQKRKLEKQIDATLHKRFQFFHTDASNLMTKLTPDMFDDKVIIMDEVHNEINGMTKTQTAKYKLYEYFMNAKNAKFIFLTATPVINKPFETSRLFNILRGYIPVLEYKLKAGLGDVVDFAKIKSNLRINKNIDQIVINKINRVVKITKNPDGYLTSNDPKHLGVEYCLDTKHPRHRMLMDVDQLKEYCDKIIRGLGYKSTFRQYNETALPEDEKEFEQKFYNPDLNKIKKPEVYKKRIANLTSFYNYKDPELFPSVNFEKIVKCPMNEYQLGIYETVRHKEIQKDKKNSMKRKGDDEQTFSSYRLDSRMACSFVFPEDMPNPYDTGYSADLYERQVEAKRASAKRRGIEFDEEEHELDDDREKQLNKLIKQTLLKTIKRKRRDYISLDNGSLLKHSPKYYAMITQMMESCKKGKALVYSYFKKLIGLNIFALCLEATGQWQEFRIKKINKEWHLVTNNPELKENELEEPSSFKKSLSKSGKSGKSNALTTKTKQTKAKWNYVFFSGDQKGEEKNIIPMIFNGKLDALPNNCGPLKRQLLTYFGDKASKNIRGDVIKCLMTTRSGAEGLDLHCIRSVHISEPYWQPVLIEQVIGRAVRTNSHIALPLSERNVDVFMYIADIPSHLIQNIKNVDVRTDVAKYNEGLDKKGKVVTSDEALYITSARKKIIADQVLQMIQDTAFDCTLTYGKNKLQQKNIVCLDYETKDRDDYLFTPSIDDTIDIVDIKQEYQVVDTYVKKMINGKEYAVAVQPSANGKQYIYPTEILSTVRAPKPVGELVSRNGRLVPALYKVKSKNSKRRSKK
jgi:hypothetical protein